MSILNFTKNKRNMISLVILLILSMACQKNYAQAPAQVMPLVFKDWQKLGESSKHIDVFYRIIKCGNANQVHLKVFNESYIDQSVQFKVEVVSTENGEKIIKELDLSLIKLQILKGECLEQNSLQALKIDLPASFNPIHISALITFKP